MTHHAPRMMNHRLLAGKKVCTDSFICARSRHPRESSKKSKKNPKTPKNPKNRKMGGDGGTCCKRRDIMTKTYQEKRKQDVSFIKKNYRYFFIDLLVIFIYRSKLF